MPKTLLDIQIAGDECLVEFESACQELIHTKYILAEKKISLLLQTIAKHKNLYALISNCVQDFDFKHELEIAKAAASGRGLVLPQERKKLVAFVFCLLLSFDTNQTDFKKFLHTFYFEAQGPGTEYERFASEAIGAFSQAVASLYYKEADEPLYKAAPPPPPPNQETVYTQTREQQNYAQTLYAQTMTADSIYSAPHVASVPFDENLQATYHQTAEMSQAELDNLAIASLLTSAREMIGIVARDSTLTLQEREELLLVCEAFEQAITLGIEKAIRTMYIALKYTIRCSPMVRQLEIQSDNLERLMQEYDLD